MNRWAKFVGLLLIAVTLVIVIAPDFDLPPTVARRASAGQRAHLAVFTAIILPSIALLPQNSKGAPVRVVFPGSGPFSASLIDLDCTRRC